MVSRLHLGSFILASCDSMSPSALPDSVVLQNMLHMPRSSLRFQVAAVLYTVQIFNFELGHAKHVSSSDPNFSIL